MSIVIAPSLSEQLSSLEADLEIESKDLESLLSGHTKLITQVHSNIV